MSKRLGGIILVSSHAADFGTTSPHTIQHSYDYSGPRIYLVQYTCVVVGTDTEYDDKSHRVTRGTKETWNLINPNQLFLYNPDYNPDKGEGAIINQTIKEE